MTVTFLCLRRRAVMPNPAITGLTTSRISSKCSPPLRGSHARCYALDVLRTWRCFAPDVLRTLRSIRKSTIHNPKSRGFLQRSWRGFYDAQVFQRLRVGALDLLL